MFIFNINFSISTTPVRGLSKNQAHISQTNHHAYQNFVYVQWQLSFWADKQLFIAFFTDLLEK